MTSVADQRSSEYASIVQQGQAKVVLTDHPWPDLDIERSIYAAAGLDLVAGGMVAGSEEDVEALVAKTDPVAIVTCWAVVSAKAITSPSRLAIVARLGVGLDNIAVATATERGAWVTNVPDYCVGEVSDHAIGLLLAHYRGIVRLDAAVKHAGWVPNGAGLNRVSDLTVGIIGYGRIGRETARKLSSFGCRMLAFARSPIVDDPWAAAADLATIQAEADVIILHAPLTDQTAHIIDAPFLSKCRRRPLLINVSRGGLVDNDALLHALENGLLRGAALDVVDGEPTPPDGIVRRADVIATPHIAFASAASIAELRRRTSEEVVRAIRGEQLRHPCNDPKLGTPLDGGVSSDIRVIDGPNGKEVVKRALAKLKVTVDWFSDPARSATEVAAIDTFARLLGPGSVPEILWTKPAENIFAMKLIDPRLRNWKQDLLAGVLDLETATSAGRILGQVHSASADDPSIAAQFGDQTFFRELRIEPFFMRVAERMPAQRDAILAVATGMGLRRTALVHGDFSPKNILADGSDVVILDFEVAHWGDPRFDVGFCLSHMMLKALRRQADPEAFVRLLRAFTTGYAATGPSIDDPDLARITGCLMLARLEGSSPVDYLADIDPGRARDIAIRLLSARDERVDQFLTMLLEHE